MNKTITIICFAVALVFAAGGAFGWETKCKQPPPHKSKPTKVINNKAKAKSTSISKAKATSSSASSATIGDIDIDVVAGGEGGTELSGEEFRQLPNSPEPRFPDAVQPVPSGKRPKNVLPLKIDDSVREENLKATFPTRLTMSEAEQWLGNEKIKAVVKSPKKLNYESDFCDWMELIPPKATNKENIYLYAKDKDVTSDGIAAAAFLHAMKSGRNAFVVQYFDDAVEPTGTTTGISLVGSNNSLAGADKTVGYTGGFMLGWTRSRLAEVGYPQAIVTAFDSGCNEESGKIICPEPPVPKAETPKAVESPKEEPQKVAPPPPPPPAPAPVPVPAPAPAPVIQKEPTSKVKALASPIYFQFKESKFLSMYRGIDNQLAAKEIAAEIRAIWPEVLQKNEVIIFLGGCDIRGSIAYNDPLSVERAASGTKAVLALLSDIPRQELIQHIRFAGMGKRQPQFPPTEHWRNRIVVAYKASSMTDFEKIKVLPIPGLDPGEPAK